MALDLSPFHNESNTIKAETFCNDDEDRFSAYLSLIKNEDEELAVAIYHGLTKGSKPVSQKWIENTLGYLPPSHHGTCVCGIDRVRHWVHLNELYRDGRMRHYKDIPMNALQIRDKYQQKRYMDQSRSTQKKGKDVAHAAGLDLVTQLNMELAPRFKLDIDFLDEFCNRFENFRVVKASTNRSLHKIVDNLLLSGDADSECSSEEAGRIRQIVAFFQDPENQELMLASGGRRRLYAKVCERVRMLNSSLWDVRSDSADLR